MLKGYQLAYNGRENVECYKAGLASTTGLEFNGIPTPQEGGKFLGLDWALPCSDNGVSVTGFDYIRATSAVKPRPDAVKTISIQDSKNGGTYGRFLVPDAYTQAQYIDDSCTGCVTVGDPLIPEPILFNGQCTTPLPVIPACVYQGALYIDPLTGANTTYTATAYGFNAAGVAIVFAPATSTGTTVALLAANMQTNWASELGGGTFTANGNTINYTSANGARTGYVVVQS